MGKKSIEDYIRENRSEFDHLSPSKSAWQNIKFRMGLQSSTSAIWWKAAAMLFFAISVFQYFYPLNPNTQNEAQSQEMALASNDFEEVESFYLDQLFEKRNLITEISQSEFGISPASENDLLRMQAMYEVLKEEYAQNKSKKLEDAMILNLIVRMDILNQEIETAESGNRSI